MRFNNILGHTCLLLFFLFSFSAHAQDSGSSQISTIKYGTENEIASLIQTLRNENADYLDNELIALVNNTRNQKILSGVFGFFGDREKSGLEERAVRAIEERDEEANETVLSAVDYLGKLKTAKAVPVLMELLENEERRFMNNSFRALGRTCSSDSNLAQQTAEFLLDYYENRDPGDEFRREIITAMGATGSSVCVPLLAGIASNTDERPPLRIAALDAISKIKDTDGLDAILGCITTNDPNVRSAAVAALGPFSGEEVDKAILDAFRDSFFRTRIAAAQSSRQRKLAAAVPYLKFRAERDDVPGVRDESIRALGEIAGSASNEEAVSVLNALFLERKNPDHVRILAADMLMKNTGGKELTRVILELDEAKKKNQTALSNGFLKVVGETKTENNKNEMEDLARRFMQNGSVTEKLYGLDMAVNNNFKNLSAEIKTLSKEKNESISRKAIRTAERLGIELGSE
ncbi:MAG: HEAT repeat domain-containing protein [Treponema sp.]|jgi:HEAT repeat protein|nr:HEAT repeat domain-containing protein [Treponema sp.]